MKKTNRYFYTVVAISTATLAITACIGINQLSVRKDQYNIATDAISNIKNNTELLESIEKLNNIEKKYGNIYAISLNKADAYYKLKDYKKSLEELNICFKEEAEAKNNPMLVYLYGKIQYLDGDTKATKETFKKAIELGILQQDITPEDIKFIEEVTKE